MTLLLKNSQQYPISIALLHFIMEAMPQKAHGEQVSGMVKSIIINTARLLLIR